MSSDGPIDESSSESLVSEVSTNVESEISDGNKLEIVVPSPSPVTVTGRIFVANTDSNREKLAQVPEIKYVPTRSGKELEITCYRSKICYFMSSKTFKQDKLSIT